jgi:hypothetical protein
MKVTRKKWDYVVSKYKNYISFKRAAQTCIHWFAVRLDGLHDSRRLQKMFQEHYKWLVGIIRRVISQYEHCHEYKTCKTSSNPHKPPFAKLMRATAFEPEET